MLLPLYGDRGLPSGTFLSAYSAEAAASADSAEEIKEDTTGVSPWSFIWATRVLITKVLGTGIRKA